jgi:hypothetical protein
MLTYSAGELIDKLCIVHLKIWHIEEEIERIKDTEGNKEKIDKLLDQVVTLNKLRVDIVSSIDEIFEGKKNEVS